VFEQQKAEAAAKCKEAGAARVIVAALVREDSKPITGTRPPYVGVEVVKATYYSLLKVEADASAPEGVLRLALPYDPKTAWLPVERVRGWQAEAERLFGFPQTQTAEERILNGGQGVYETGLPGDAEAIAWLQATEQKARELVRADGEAQA
jgi:hypothetical protein